MELIDGLKLIENLSRATIKQSTLYRHNKTGNVYIVLNDSLVECTNGREEKKYTLYANQDGVIFCRDTEEFNQKFTKL